MAGLPQSRYPPAPTTRPDQTIPGHFTDRHADWHGEERLGSAAPPSWYPCLRSVRSSHCDRGLGIRRELKDSRRLAPRPVEWRATYWSRQRQVSRNRRPREGDERNRARHSHQRGSRFLTLRGVVGLVPARTWLGSVRICTGCRIRCRWMSRGSGRSRSGRMHTKAQVACHCSVRAVSGRLPQYGGHIVRQRQS